MNRQTLPRFGLLALTAALAAAIPADASWRRALLQQRAAKDLEFRTSPTSPMAGVARLGVPAPGPATLVARRDGVAVLAANENGPAPGTRQESLRLSQRDGHWVYANSAGNKAVSPGTPVCLGRYTLLCYPAADALTVLVFDPQRPMRLRFRGLRYFPPAPGWAVPARLERLAEPQPVRMQTTRNLQKAFFRYARIRFRAANRELTLTAFKAALQGEEAATLFIPFSDESNGRSTYEVGRFLEVSEPPETEFILDFNAAFNPLCNYSPAYNCPMPPRENHLPIPVPAGEMVYAHEKDDTRGE